MKGQGENVECVESESQKQDGGYITVKDTMTETCSKLVKYINGKPMNTKSDK